MNCRYCGMTIFFDDSRVSRRGIKIPLVKTGAGALIQHECSKAPYNNTRRGKKRYMRYNQFIAGFL